VPRGAGLLGETGGCARAVGAATDTPIGLIPPVGDDRIDTRGLDVSDEDMAELRRVDVDEWKAQLPQFRTHLPAKPNPAARCARSSARLVASPGPTLGTERLLARRWIAG
jgi:hypothetical protein